MKKPKTHTKKKGKEGNKGGLPPLGTPNFKKRKNNPNPSHRQQNKGGALAAHHDASQLSLQPVGAGPVLFHQGDLVTPLQQVAGKEISDLPAADDYRVHGRPQSINSAVASVCLPVTIWQVI